MNPKTKKIIRYILYAPLFAVALVIGGYITRDSLVESTLVLTAEEVYINVGPDQDTTKLIFRPNNKMVLIHYGKNVDYCLMEVRGQGYHKYPFGLYRRKGSAWKFITSKNSNSIMDLHIKVVTNNTRIKSIYPDPGIKRTILVFHDNGVILGDNKGFNRMEFLKSSVDKRDNTYIGLFSILHSF